MSNKQSRHTPSPAPSSPSPSNANHATSKLPKFLQKPGNRDRSKSVTDPSGSPSTSSLASGSSASTSPELIHSSIPISKPRKTSKFLGLKDKDKEEKARKSSEAPLPPPPVADNSTQQPNNGNISVDMDEPPVIVEPVAIPRSRTRSERPVNSAPDSHLHHVPTLYSSTSSTSRIGDLPTRLSGWFSHTFSSSSTDLSLPTLLAQQASPKGKGPSALITAAKNGKGHLDKAMRYLLDSDAMPDKCTDPIWLLGVQHPGYEPSNQALPNVVSSYSANNLSTSQRRGSAGSPPSFRSSTSSIASSADLSLSQSSKHPNPAANWPPVFYIDSASRICRSSQPRFELRGCHSWELGGGAGRRGRVILNMVSQELPRRKYRTCDEYTRSQQHVFVYSTIYYVFCAILPMRDSEFGIPTHLALNHHDVPHLFTFLHHHIVDPWYRHARHCNIPLAR
ncbi:hypothetical protein B0H34DRAFT_544344 [Crassisporium funariophilum]|nr:hypothetical protein B0H34DRAFT_544344 [Crassisporium funariophilum]